MARSWHRNRALTRQSTNGVFYTDIVDLTFDPIPNESYYILWSVQFDVSVTSNNAKHRLRDDTAGSNLANPVHRAPNVADVMSAGGLSRWTSGASPQTQTFSVEHAVDVATTTLGSGDAYLMAISAAATDEYAESTSTSTTSTSSLADKVALGFSPIASGDYLIICSCEINGFVPASSDGTGRVLLDINNTQYFDTSEGYFAQTNGQYASWCHSVVINFSATPQLLKIRYASSDNTTLAQIRQARILAIRLDSIAAAYTAQQSTRQSTTASSPQMAAETTFGAQGRDYLFIGTALIDHSSSASPMEARVNWSGTTRSAFKRRQVGVGARRASFVALGYDALAPGTQVVRLDWWRTTSGTASVTNAFIGSFLIAPDTEIVVPSASCGFYGATPAVEVGAAVVVPFYVATLVGRILGVVSDLVLRPGTISVGFIGPEHVSAVDRVIGSSAAMVMLTPYVPVRGGPLWRAVDETQSIWGDVASPTSIWSQVSAT